MHRLAAPLAIAVSALGCAHRSRSVSAHDAELEHAGEAADAPLGHGPSSRVESPDAWWHREIGEREARIESLRQQVTAADRRDDDEEEERISAELEFEQESMEQFRKASTQDYSADLVVGGIALTVVGAAAAFTGLVIALAASSYRSNPVSDGVSDQDDNTVAVLLVAPVGAGCVLAGVPLLLIGTRKVPKSRDGAGLWVGPGEVGVRGSF